MPSKEDKEVLEYLRSFKGGHVRRVVDQIHASGEVSSFITATSGTSVPQSVTTTQSQRRKSKTSIPTRPIKSAVKFHIKRLERKIAEQSKSTSARGKLRYSFPLPQPNRLESTSTRSKARFSCPPLPPRTYLRITVSPRFASYPKQQYQKSWDNDDDTTVSTVSMSSMSMNSSYSNRSIMEIKFEGSFPNTERSSSAFFGSPSNESIQKIGLIDIDTCNELTPSYEQPRFSFLDSPSETSKAVEEENEKRFANCYFIFSIFLLSVKGIDPIAVCTIYILLEIFRQHV